mmetsp:Transcript_26090/g.61971  ORF Transcript_26090/g.61971 Transcript_26090/m.61971 type:complete len:216 (+) Transcript_26090:512-1159(+)
MHDSMKRSQSSRCSTFSAASTNSAPMREGLIGPLPMRFRLRQCIPSFSAGVTLSASDGNVSCSCFSSPMENVATHCSRTSTKTSTHFVFSMPSLFRSMPCMSTGPSRVTATVERVTSFGEPSLAAAVPSSSCPRRIDMPSFISVFPFANALENALENVFSILISVHTHSCSSSKLYNGAPPPPSEPLPLSQASNTKSVQPEAGSSCGREQRIGCN